MVRITRWPPDLTIAPTRAVTSYHTNSRFRPRIRERAREGECPGVDVARHGSTLGSALSSLVAPSDDFIVADFTGKGFDAANVTNTSSRTLKVTFTTIPGPRGTSRPARSSWRPRRPNAS